MATTPSPHDPVAPGTRDNRSLASLFGELTQELSALVRQEVALARAEVSEKVSQVGSGLASLAAGGMIILTGLFFLVQAVVFGVAAILELFMSAENAAWLSPLLIGLPQLHHGIGDRSALPVHHLADDADALASRLPRHLPAGDTGERISVLLGR